MKQVKHYCPAEIVDIEFLEKGSPVVKNAMGSNEAVCTKNFFEKVRQNYDY